MFVFEPTPDVSSPRFLPGGIDRFTHLPPSLTSRHARQMVRAPPLEIRDVVRDFGERAPHECLSASATFDGVPGRRGDERIGEEMR